MSGGGRSLKSWGLFALAAGLAVVGLLALGDEADRSADFQKYSSLRAEPDGLLALHELARRMGRPVERSKTRLYALPADGLAVLAQPHGAVDRAGMRALLKIKDYDKKEIAALRTWVESGGTLLIAASAESELHEAFSLKVQSFPEREGDGLSAEPRALVPLVSGGDALSLKRRVGLKDSSGEWLFLHGFGGGGPPCSAVRFLGAGRVIALADPHPISNGGLAAPGNAGFVGALLRSGAGPVVFDEFRHGLQEELGLFSYARRISLDLVFFQLLVAFGVVWWSVSARTGRVRAPRSPAGIESREFLTAMANIYDKARLQGHALRWFERRLVLVLRHITGFEQARRVEDFEAEAVAKKLRELGVKNYQGFGAYLDFRAAVLGRTATTAEGRPDWDRLRGLSDRELLALSRLSVQLEREWTAAGGLYTGARLLQDAGFEDRGPPTSGPEVEANKDEAAAEAEDEAAAEAEDAAARSPEEEANRGEAVRGEPAGEVDQG